MYNTSPQITIEKSLTLKKQKSSPKKKSTERLKKMSSNASNVVSNLKLPTESLNIQETSALILTEVANKYDKVKKKCAEEIPKKNQNAIAQNKKLLRDLTTRI